MPMKIRTVSAEVYQAEGPVVGVNREQMRYIQERAAEAPRKRARLCAHPDKDDLTHEMLVVLGRGTYLHPHIHRDKVESFHVIEGLMTTVLFEEDGRIMEVIPQGDYRSGRAFYYRQQRPIYHCILPETEFVTFQEVTQGPFIGLKNTTMAPWCPADEAGLKAYVDDLRARVCPGPVLA